MEDIDFSDIEAKYKIDVPETFDNVVVVDNVPIVDHTKEEKLLNVIRKVFKNIGTIKENGIYMPKGDDGKSKGFMFIQFETVDQAKLAIQQANGYKLDKSHILEVSAFDDIETYANADDEYVEPEIEEFEPKEHLKYWLGDARARDQFAILKGDEVTVYWNNKHELPDKVQSRQGWSENFISWSKQGTYFVTTHKQGVALWGGPSWKKINRFTHPNVTNIDFSPNEKYLVTWSNDPFKVADGQLHALCVWDVLTGALLRSFPAPNQDKKSSEPIGWPLLKWSHDDQYVARMVAGASGTIYVYEAQTMSLLGKKSIKVENLKEFHWSPSENTISYWTPEIGNIPARVTLMSIPSRVVTRTKNFFNVIDCKLYWQPAGDYLLVRVDRSKSKTMTITSFEVFRMREKDIPIDVMELKATEEMTNLFWEPVGNRFALMVAEKGTPYMYFFEVQTNNASSAGSAAVKELKRIEAKGINQVFWSPKGRVCVLAGVKGLSGDLQFWDVEELTMLGAGEHYMCTDVEWDPTGRYVMTSVSGWRVQNDTGVMIWSVAGQEITKQNMTGFKQVVWRPRPKTLLSIAQQKKVKKNLKEYSKLFDEEDAMESNKASVEVQERRRALWKEYKSLMDEFAESAAKEAEERKEAYGSDPLDLNTGEWVEEVLEEIEEVVDE
jgi:translation initiation factor 3 subunit B